MFRAEFEKNHSKQILRIGLNWIELNWIEWNWIEWNTTNIIPSKHIYITFIRTTRHPCFGKDGSLPPPPDPTTGGIELHHDGPPCTGPDTLVNEIVQ